MSTDNLFPQDAERTSQLQGVLYVAKIHQIFGRYMNKQIQRWKSLGINPSHGRILLALKRKGPMSLSELVRETALDKSGLSLVLDRLEGRGFVTRKTLKEDRRKIRIEIGELPQGFWEDYEKSLFLATGQFYHGFSDQEIELTENFLRRILNNFL